VSAEEDGMDATGREHVSDGDGDGEGTMIRAQGGAELLAAARALAPELSVRAAEAEQLRTLPADIVAKLREAGFFNLGLPAELGGLQLDPLSIIEIVEELSRADGSAGWTTLIGNSGTFMAWLDPDVAKEIVASRPRVVVAGAFAPSGTARTDESGRKFRVNGRWTFNSGCPHADWFMHGVIVMDGDGPRMLPNGSPDWRFAWYPASEGEIVDTWHVSGLRGTGSHDVVARDVMIPAERTSMHFFEPARASGALYQLPLPTLASGLVVGFPLGVARRALDEFVTLAGRKSRMIPPGPPMAEDDSVQVELARAEALLRSARAFVFEAYGATFETVSRGDTVSDDQRLHTTLAFVNAGRAARTAVDIVFSMAGGGSLYDDSPIQRCARDLAAGTQHFLFSLARWKTAGRLVLGVDPKTFMY
jgi:alkylation response protein AidB-like acyl-CoA dehydrogenase